MNDIADRLALHELIGLHGHLMDDGAFDRLDELFVEGVVYDVSALGGGRLVGGAQVAEAGRTLGDANPVGHHVTNVVVVRLDGDVATVRSKGLGVMLDGSVGSVVYEDECRRTPAGWRIAVRRVLPRPRPLHAAEESATGTGDRDD